MDGCLLTWILVGRGDTSWEGGAKIHAGDVCQGSNQQGCNEKPHWQHCWVVYRSLLLGASGRESAGVAQMESIVDSTLV